VQAIEKMFMNWILAMISRVSAFLSRWMGIGVGAAPGPTSESKRGHCEPVERISVQRRTIGLLL
jgi:hypothetical protein